jgi:site-specific recombinase XerC
LMGPCYRHEEGEDLDSLICRIGACKLVHNQLMHLSSTTQFVHSSSKRTWKQHIRYECADSPYTSGEFQAILGELELRERAMVMLVALTGLRRSELIALRWSDVNLQTMKIAVTRSCVRNQFEVVKTEASGKPVALHDAVREVLIE